MIDYLKRKWRFLLACGIFVYPECGDMEALAMEIDISLSRAEPPFSIDKIRLFFHIVY